MSNGKKPFSMYEYGDGTYAYFAVVTKNYDDAGEDGGRKGTPSHFNEIQVQALPYSMDYTGSTKDDSHLKKLDPDDGKVWLPYLCDLVGYDTSIQGDGAKTDSHGYGFHHVPEVGSVVIVLAIESGFPGYAQHVVIGSFWNRQLITPQLDKFAYSIANKIDYNMDHLLGDDAEKKQAFANTPFYRTKAGTTFIRDELKKVFGFYKVPKKDPNDEKERNKRTSYFMVDEKDGNLDIKVNSFTVTAKNINIQVKKGLEINNKQNYFEFSTEEELLNFNTADEGSGDFNVEAAKEISVKGDKVNLNKGNPPKKIDPKKPRRLKIDNKDPNDPGNETPEFCQLAIRQLVEINVLRKSADFMGKEKIISLDKGTVVLTGQKKQGNLKDRDFELKFSLDANDNDCILAELNEKFGDRRLYDLEKAENKIEIKSQDPPGIISESSLEVLDDLKNYEGNDISEMLLRNMNVKGKADLSKAKKTGTVDVVRKVIFTYNDPNKGEDLTVTVHYLDLSGDFPGQVLKPEGSGFNIIAPKYCQETKELKAKTSNTWMQIVKNKDNAEVVSSFLVDKNGNNCKDFYVDAYAAVNEGELKPAGSGDYLKNPGVVKFTLAPVALGAPSRVAEKEVELCVSNIDPVDVGDIAKMTIAKYANFNVSKKGSNEPESVPGLVGLNQTLVNHLDPKCPKKVDVWVLYRVKRSLPVFLLCRDITDKQYPGKRGTNTGKVRTGEFPVFEGDVYGSESFLKSSKDVAVIDGNPLWKLTNCTDENGYKNLLRNVPNDAFKKEAMLYVNAARVGEVMLGRYTDASDKGGKAYCEDYSEYAGNDKLVKYDPDPDKWKIISNDRDRLNIASYEDAEKPGEYVPVSILEIKDNVRNVKGVERNFKHSNKAPRFLSWKRVDNIGEIKKVNDKDKDGFGGMTKEFVDRMTNYSFAFVSTYVGMGSAQIYRPYEEMRSVIEQGQKKEEKK